MLYFSFTLILINTFLSIWYNVYGESFFSIFPNMDEIKVILPYLFDNNLYMNTNSNEDINISSVDGQSIVSNENTNNANGESTTNNELINSNENIEFSDNDSEDTSSNVSSAEHLDRTCPCVTEPGHPGCDCNHPLAYIGNNISDRENRCHVCSEYGSTTRCAICDCLLHIYCLPHDCVIESDPED